MSTRKQFTVVSFCMMALSQNLFSQSILEGVVKDTGSEPVQNALVVLTDQADTSSTFTDSTDEQGRYRIQIIKSGIEDCRSRNPGTFNLLQNYPNPFNPSTVIAYELSRPAVIRIEIYNILGRKIKTLFDGFQSDRSGRIVWDATDDRGQGVPAGVYIYSLRTDGIRINRKMLLIDGGQGGSNPTLSKPMAAQNASNKQMSDQYRLRITCNDIETYEQQNLQITGNTVLDVTVYRTVTDIDGNAYRTVKIGDQWWFAENLKVTHYRNGDEIPNVTGNTDWANLTTGAYCSYNNSSKVVSTYGLLYNWYAVDDSRNIAPAGWHVSSDAEWQTLVDYLGGETVADEKLKETGKTNWPSGNPGATNESGFSALPGGLRSDYGGTFMALGVSAVFWSSTEDGSLFAWFRTMNDNDGGPGGSAVYRAFNYKPNGNAVRCVRN